MSILAKHYKLVDKLTIANNEIVNIDPDTPYTVVYLISDRNCAQITGIIRGVMSGDSHMIVVIPLDTEDVNFATIVDTYKITKVSPYTFQAHFENFNNWIGVEVAEKSRIDLRVRYINGESIVPVEQGKTYNITYVEKVDGSINLIEGTGRIRSIIRSTTKEELPQHINCFTNDIDYILVVDFASSNYSSDVRSINVTEIRSIALALEDSSITTVDKSELAVAIAAYSTLDESLYAHASWDEFVRAYANAGRVNANPNATEEEVNSAIAKLNEAVENLQLLSDEYDLVEYDEETNTLYCHESPYQVVVTGRLDGEFNDIKYMTNFGTQKMIEGKRSLNIVWASSGTDIARRKPRPKGKKFLVQDPASLYITDGATIDNIYLGHKIIHDPDDPEKIIDNSIIFKAEKCGINNLFFGGLDTDHPGTRNKVFLYSVAGAEDFFNIYGKWQAIGAEEEAETNLEAKLKNNTCVFMGSCLDEGSCMVEAESDMLLNVVRSNLKEIYCGGINSYAKYNSCAIYKSEILNLYTSGIGTESEVAGAYYNISESHIGNIVYIATGSVIHSTSVKTKSSLVDKILIGAYEEDTDSMFRFTDPKPDGSSADNKLMLLMSEGTVVNELMVGYSGGEKIPLDYIVVTKDILVKNDYDGLLEVSEEKLIENINSDPERPKG